MLREKEYDPLQTLRDRLSMLERRTLETEQRLRQLTYWREKRKRYTVLRKFRNRAILSLYALDKLTLSEIAMVFGVTKQRVAQIRKRKQ